MSFIGAVATSVRQVLAQYAKEVHLPCLIVGAGNFTVPSVLRSAGFPGTITACDVTLYTSALGAYLSGCTLEAREREDCPEHLRGLLRTGSPLELTASISLLMDLREVWKGDNAFKMRMVQHSREAWDTLMEKTCARLETYKAHIGPIDYQARDGFDLLEKSVSRHTVFAFPPTYKSENEKLEALLWATVEWTPPAYREMTDKSLELFEAIARFDSYYVVLEKDLPEVYALLGQPSAVLPRGRGRTTYIVAKQAKKVVIRSSAKTAPVGPIWPANRPVSGDEAPGFAPVKRIDYFDGGVDICIVLTLDGQVIGKADFMKTSHAQWKLPEDNPGGDESLYIMCDLAVASDVEKRLAKLVLLLLTSREVKEWVDAKLNKRIGWVITTAFTNGPVSMKYRGVFQLYSRKKDKKTGQYALNYFSMFGRRTLDESFALWRKKYK